MASITSLGVGSGLTNLEDLLKNLRTSEELRLNRITSQQNSYKSRISAFSKIQGGVEAVQKAAAALADPATLGAVKHTVSGDGLTVKTAAGAVAGDYKIAISQLAVAQTLKSGAVESRTTQLGSGGAIEIALQNGESAKVELGTDTSLNGIAKAINGSDDVGVRATIITDGNGESYLMLTSKATGEKAAVQSITSDNTAVQGVVGYQAGAASPMSEQQEAKNALITINGIAVESQSNTIADAIDGVTLELADTTEPGEFVTVSVTSDPAALSKAVKGFVDAYNGLQATIGSLTAFDVEEQTQSALTGDSTTRAIQSSLAAALRVATSEGALRTLTQLGVTTNPTSGNLQLDQAKLDEALAANPGDVARVLSGTGGLAEKFKAATDGILGANGSIKTRSEGLQKTVDTLQSQYDSTKESIEATMSIYRAQFTRLDALVTQMNSMSTYLTQQFAALSGNSNK
ncbi:flagellar hook protein FliD [Bordetella genomosp. 7]|uniref:Flagellar hook-associated protein 2 n=1 Tax=Bordetella genomosp. 7 TaxID=1416805 RepID=A0A261RBG8_9BORD|nr:MULTISPECIES: flagellar filament capping protein FliD [Bordetella]OZI22368.1 flagellar hook protein FliD [Bordetella genomosp. 7]OZI27072.1 flagellar hook protein FliD [Bordetella genomosp. 7]